LASFPAKRDASTSSYSGSSDRSVSATTPALLAASAGIAGIVTPSLARCVSTVGTVVLELEDAFVPFGAVFKVSEDPETPSPRDAARPRAVAAASFSLSARDGRVAAASADLTSPAVARVVVAVTTFAVAAASADAGLRVGRGMRVRNVAASSFPSRRLMLPGEGPSGPDQRSPERAPSADASRRKSRTRKFPTRRYGRARLEVCARASRRASSRGRRGERHRDTEK
jgi:hypothetical protein